MQRKKTTVIVLEHDWRTEGCEHFSYSASVRPFFNALAEFRADFNFHFYHFQNGKKNLEKAIGHFEEFLKRQNERVILYIGAHGTEGTIASTNLSSVFNILKTTEIRCELGIILGSCSCGTKEGRLMEYLKGSQADWLLAYKKTVPWLEGTLLDLCFVNKLISENQSFKSRNAKTQKNAYKNSEILPFVFKEVTETFNLTSFGEKGDPIHVPSDFITLIIRNRKTVENCSAALNPACVSTTED